MKMKVGAIQLTSGLDYKSNLQKIRTFLAQAKEDQVKYVFLPEVFYSMSDGLTPTPYLVEAHNEHYQNIKSLAVDFGVYLLGGSAATLNQDKKIVNRAYNFSPKGEDLGHYDKCHLFSCEIEKEGKVKKIDEGIIYTKGHEAKMIKAQDLKVGLSICFDLRFPEFYRNYNQQGANVFSISSAFTVPTGKAHWHTLVRARAIENQCFVIASAQWGKHNDKIQTFGHSLIVSPWGEVLADAADGEKLIQAEINLDEIQSVRKSVKM